MPVSVDSQKRTIMHIAASNPSNECLDTIYTFVKDKDEILKQDTIGYTPLHYAVKYGKRKQKTTFSIYYHLYKACFI